MLNITTNGYVLPFISKSNLARFPLSQSGFKALQKTKLWSLVSSLFCQERNRRVENVKSLRFYNPQASPKVEASNRLKQAQHFSTHRKVQNGNSRGLQTSRGMGIVDRSIGRLPSHPHPPKLREIPKVLPQLTDVPVHLSSFWPGHSPSVLHNDGKGSEANGPLEGTQTSPIPGRLADQGPVS